MVVVVVRPSVRPRAGNPGSWFRIWLLGFPRRLLMLLARTPRGGLETPLGLLFQGGHVQLLWLGNVVQLWWNLLAWCRDWIAGKRIASLWRVGE